MKRETNSESLKEVIERFLKKYDLDGKYNEQRVAACWNDLLGKVIAGKTTDISLKNGTLTVKLESSVIRNELNFAKEKLMSELNASLGVEAIHTIELR